MYHHCSQFQTKNYQHKRQTNSIRYKQKTEGHQYHSTYALSLSNSRQKFFRQTQLKQSDSFQTCDSENHHDDSHYSMPKRSNIKVELCKNFVEKGYCPYDNRCKFAHGIEELRAKDTYHKNSQLYRTRKCKIFYQKHQCRFGQRCNFMHQNRQIKEIIQKNRLHTREAIRNQFQQINFILYQSRVKQSRLLKLLGQQSQ